MESYKFELFITYKDQQLSLVVGDKPILFGVSANCDIKIGDGEPKVKAMIQKEGEHLNVKIFDVQHPVIINNKKYKTAKIKKSVFFKIGDVDIITSVEKIDEPVTPPPIQDDTLPEFRDTGITQTHSLNIPNVPEVVEAKVEAPLESKPKPNNNLNEVNVEVQKDLTSTKDIFSFSIKFPDKVENERYFQKYEDHTYNYDNYIELYDESVKRLPIPEIHKDKGTKSVHIIHTNNGTVLSENYYPVTKNRLFVSNIKNGRNYVQIHDCEQTKAEFIYFREGQAFVSCIDGYNIHKVYDEKVVPIQSGSTQLSGDERVVLTKGTGQIIIQKSKTPPSIKTNRFLNVENDLLKSLAVSWSFILLFIVSVMLFPPVEKSKKENKRVVILKRQKKKLDNKKPLIKEVEVEKTVQAKETKNEPTPVKKTTPPAPEKKVVKTPPKESVKQVKKNTARVKSTKKRVRRSKKSAPRRVRQKIVAKARRKAPPKVEKPKKKFKFNFGNNLNSKKIKLNNNNEKTANTQSNVNVANAFNSSSAVTKGIKGSRSFGKTSNKLGKFKTSGSRSFSKNASARGLSSKRGIATAYLQANTKILGAIDPNLIRKLMREYIPEFRRCYQRELVKNPKVAGVFDVAFQINSIGKGVNVNVKSNGVSFSSNGQTCLRRVVSLIKFPRPKGGGLVDVKQPMNFYNQ